MNFYRGNETQSQAQLQEHPKGRDQLPRFGRTDGPIPRDHTKVEAAQAALKAELWSVWGGKA